MSERIKLKRVRVSYAHLWKPRATAGSEPRFSVSLIIPKSDKEQLAAIKLAIEKVRDEAWPDPKKRPGGLHVPLRDGDADRPNDEAYADSFFINASTAADQPPQVVDNNLEPAASTRWNSGDYANVAVDFYPFNRPEKKGIGCGLVAVQFVKKGEPLSGRGNALAGFEVEDEEDSPFS